ncbi:MAG: DUF4444 domain-containing protein [Pseudomonadota bacterium]
MNGIMFPPLLTGLAVAGDPFDVACKAAPNADPGSVFFSPDSDRFQAAVILAPETLLAEAISVSFAVSLAINDAIGALGPPEVAFHLEWPGAFRVNGAACGTMRARASTDETEKEPDWLVIGLDMPMIDAGGDTSGATPDVTTLHAEGCGEITVPDLTEAWARHMMNWLHIYLSDGFAPLHEEWRARAYRLGEEIVSPEAGTFLGLDERGGMILKQDETTHILPLTLLLERP